MLHVKVPKSNAEETIREFKKRNIIAKDYEILRFAETLLIPITRKEDELLSGFQLEDHEGIPKHEKNYPARHSGSFDVIGKIAIVKVRTLDRAEEIAKSIIETNHSIESVYFGGKLSEGERVRNLILLAGKDNTVTIHRENGLKFKVDVSKVYFSPRLATERKILSSEVKEGEVVLDLFAGIGPFSITIAASKACTIEAVDINPFAVDLMKENLSLNKLKGSISTICQDSNVYLKESRRIFDRIVMNLPFEAVDFIPMAAKHLHRSGVINLYFISDIETLTSTMEEMRKAGLNLESKRIVHGYSRDKHLYSLALRNSK